MRILIVDDERPARDRLRRLLTACADVAAIEEARDGREALERAESFRPDALFLDIQMPEINGIEVAASLPDPAPPVVFVTAYDRYAVQAFDAEAVDYLLKPYDEQRFLRALQRVRERLAAKPADRPATERHLPRAAPLERLLVPERGGTRVVPVAEIGWIETADNYVLLHAGGREHLMRQTLSGLLPALGPAFARCHRRAAVRLDAVARLVPNDKGDAELVLHDGSLVPCSRQYRAELVTLLKLG